MRYFAIDSTDAISLAQTLAQALVLVPQVEWIEDVVFPAVADTPLLIPHSRVDVPQGWIANSKVAGAVSFYALPNDRARWGRSLVLRCTAASVRAKIGIVF